MVSLHNTPEFLGNGIRNKGDYFPIFCLALSLSHRNTTDRLWHGTTQRP